MNDAVIYIVSHLNITLRDLRTAFVWYTIFCCSLLSCLIFLFLIFEGSGLWGYDFNTVISGIVSLLLFTRVFGMLGRGLLIADHRYKLSIILDFADVILPFALFVSFSEIYGASLEGAACAYLIGSFIVSVFIFLSLSSYAQPFPGFAIVLSVLKKTFAYGIHTLSRAISSIFLQRADYFLVGTFLGLKSLGVYSIAQTIVEAVLRIPDSASWVLAPQVSKNDRRNTHVTMMHFLPHVVLLSTIGILVAALLAPPFVIYTVGSGYEDITPVLYALLIGVIGSTVYKVLGSVLIACGNAYFVSISTWVGASIMLTLDIILLPTMGLLGAGIAAIFGYSISAVMVFQAYLSLLRDH